MYETKMLIDRFTDEYTEKLFYFCLKKTGNSVEAEDLASDIALNVLTALKKGVIPDSFSAYVWQIARNRYSRWADDKRKRSERISGEDIENFEVESDESTENEMIHSEELKLLRRELAFISSEYRSILIAFYIDDRRVTDIADTLDLPKGTVMTKLRRARTKLKEGMNMAREFGARSYKPENVDFSSSGPQPTGLPWSAVQRSISKNILLEASNNPSTLEELAIALGIALPYMEEEVELLVKATLLKKLDDGRFITDFYISSAECQRRIYDALCRDSAKRSSLINEIITSALPLIREHKTAPEAMSDNDVKWWAVMMIADLIAQKIADVESCHRVRANGESWGFMGYEDVTLPRPLFSGHSGTGSNSGDQFWAFQISNFGMWERVGLMEYSEMVLLADILRNGRTVDSFTQSEHIIWGSINNRFAHEENGRVIPDIIVITSEARKAMLERLYSDPKTEKLIDLTRSLYGEIRELIISDTSKHNKDEADYAAQMFLLHTRMTAVYDLVDSGDLIVPDCPSKSSVAMWLDLVD
ncbi:MAG: sigma-70 family RNA polymerase sigma factor [Clostridia bacterium]|nr:sigma-70 family RNA polymerase sigma factor [Clostridia bacterium]